MNILYVLLRILVIKKKDTMNIRADVIFEFWYSESGENNILGAKVMDKYKINIIY